MTFLIYMCQIQIKKITIMFSFVPKPKKQFWWHLLCTDVYPKESYMFYLLRSFSMHGLCLKILYFRTWCNFYQKKRKRKSRQSTGGPLGSIERFKFVPHKTFFWLNLCPSFCLHLQHFVVC